MGGYGSGRWHTGRRTTGGMWRLDVRWLHREGLLTVGRCSTVRWSHNGQPAASISVSAHDGQVMLKYRSRSQGGDWEDMEYSVALQWTGCRFGGQRPWFLCPSCGRRVAVLWGGTIYACRHCHKLAYTSQREDRCGRLLSRSLKIRERLGWDDDYGQKPKGMHWKTYHRLVQEHEWADAASWQAAAEKFNIRLP